MNKLIENKRRKRATGPGRRNNRTTKKRSLSAINPENLIKKPVYVDKSEQAPLQDFESMPLHRALKANILGKGYTNATQIQSETFGHLVEGKDLMGIANTGTGKTGAFLIPIIEQLLNRPKPFVTLVVVPTRELALQVTEEFNGLAKGLGFYSACFVGGQSIQKDLSRLRKKNHLIIGTPGRLLDLVNRRALRLDNISTLVLDEFDRMLDMGFITDINKIIQQMTERSQTIMFSATVDKSQAGLLSKILRNPVEVKVNPGTAASDQVHQDIIRVRNGEDKYDLLLGMMDNSEFEKVLIFTETKRLAERLSKKLNASGVRCDQIHGNKSQNYRNNALSKFKKGSIRVLVATDVAARGIDVSDISHVINYQLPMTFDSYVHRIGRTGRAGKMGKALTFID